MYERKAIAKKILENIEKKQDFKNKFFFHTGRALMPIFSTVISKLFSYSNENPNFRIL